jgi:hypothetical protein
LHAEETYRGFRANPLFLKEYSTWYNYLALDDVEFLSAISENRTIMSYFEGDSNSGMSDNVQF